MLDRRCFVVLVATLCLAQGTAGALIPEELKTRIEQVTGPDPVVCNELLGKPDRRTPATAEELAVAVKCARGASERKTPFWLLVKVGGIDSWFGYGLLAGRDGQIQAFLYDSDPAGGAGAAPTFSVRPCRGFTLSESPSLTELRCGEDR
jgi:hypothetical protein